MSTAAAEVVPDKRCGQAFLLVGVAGILMLTLGIGTQAISMRIGLAITLVFCVLTPAVVFVRMKGIPLREGFRLRPVSPSILIASLLLGACGWSVAASIALGLVELGFPHAPVAFEVESRLDFLLLLIVAAVLPGFCEECLFRGAIQGVLERRGSWFGILVAGLLFGLFHLDPTRIVAATYLGIVAGWLVVRTGSLWPAILSHFANNAVATSVGYLLGGTTEMPAWLLPSLAGGFAITLAVFIRLTRPNRDAPDEPSPLATVPAGLSPAVAWGCGIPGVLFAGSVLVGMAALTAMISVETAADDGAAPSVRGGDQVVLIQRGSVIFSPRKGGHVALKRDDEVIVREVARVVGDTLWVVEDGTETEVTGDDVLGAVAQVIPTSAAKDDPD